jgi:hypothetical protein
LHRAGAPPVDRACRPLLLALKMAAKDLRLFFDSRCLMRGTPHWRGRLAIGFELLLGEGTLWTRRRQELASPT